MRKLGILIPSKYKDSCVMSMRSIFPKETVKTWIDLYLDYDSAKEIEKYLTTLTDQELHSYYGDSIDKDRKTSLDIISRKAHYLYGRFSIDNSKLYYSSDCVNTINGELSNFTVTDYRAERVLLVPSAIKDEGFIHPIALKQLFNLLLVRGTTETSLFRKLVSVSGELEKIVKLENENLFTEAKISFYYTK